jgi:hypothetical protein
MSLTLPISGFKAALTNHIVACNDMNRLKAAPSKSLSQGDDKVALSSDGFRSCRSWAKSSIVKGALHFVRHSDVLSDHMM